MKKLTFDFKSTYQLFTVQLVCFVLLTITAIAQAPPLERIVTIRVNNERLDNTLKQISNAANFTFSYNPSDIEVSKKVSLNAPNQTVREVLTTIFENSVRFKSRGNYVILQKTETKENDDFFVMGYVSDGETGLKIERVSIYEPISLASAVTNQYGYYRIKISSELNNVNLLVRKQNYEGEKVAIKSKQDKVINIKLSPIKVAEAKKIATPVEIIRPISIKYDTIPEKKLDSIPSIIIPPTIEEKTETNNDNLFKYNYRKDFDYIQNRLTDWFLTAKQAIHEQNVGDTLYRPFQVSLFPFVGTNHTLSGNVINDFSLNIIAGYSLGVRVLEMGAVANLVKGNVNGGQFSGVINLVGQDVTGLQGAGFLNLVGREMYGVQGAGFANINVGLAKGMQASGFTNIAAKNFSGVQGTGFANLVARNMPVGVQGAGFANFVGGNANGVQASGGLNFVGGNLRGVQASGGLNIVGGNLQGFQVGVFNFANKVKSGMQVGVFNYSKENKGLPIGVLSFVSKGGYKRLEINTDEVNLLNVTFKTGIPAFYNILTAGYNFNIEGRPGWSYGYGIGTARRFNKLFWMDLNLVSSALEFWNRGEVNNIHKLSLALEFHLSRRLALFVAPTANLHLSNVAKLDFDNYGLPKSQPKDVRVFGNDLQMTSWIGFQGGIRICNR
ncbi:MAG: hypothetical protein MUF45_02640 [Spirosomaceae bacterium]|nr:hypothetical protein [Spirosomataceae bacterium]